MPVFAKIAQHLRKIGELPKPEKEDYLAWKFTDPKKPFAINFKADEMWLLTGYDKAENREYKIHMLPGEFTLDFNPHSVNLALLAIDPDPGGGGLIE